ncbi:MAG: nuclear transport factor 2 family protein [Alphaproteobacteria bacterium]|nr:nuclear transport factor 2 family protein [Alphaproteobacteria bacterium]
MNDPSDDRQQIEIAVTRYFDGLYNSNGDDIRATFHPDAKVTGFMSSTGEMSAMDFERFVAFVESQTSPASAGEPYELDIVSIDIAGQVATAKLLDRYLDIRFTDYLSLVKDDQGWRVYNKLWHAEPI